MNPTIEYWLTIFLVIVAAVYVNYYVNKALKWLRERFGGIRW